MSILRNRVVWVALLMMGSAILLFSCKSKPQATEVPLDAVMTEESENLTIVMSENGRKSYLFKAPKLEGYMLGRDPYREFRKGISITTYQDDSLTTVNAVLVANYAIYYENRKLWEAKGDVVITKHDGTRLYTQQLFWNSITKRIYSNVDTKLVTDTDEVVGEGFESDEDMNEPRFRRWQARMYVNPDTLQEDAQNESGEKKEPLEQNGEISEKPKQVESTKKTEPMGETPNNSGVNKPSKSPKRAVSALDNPDNPLTKNKPSAADGGPAMQRRNLAPSSSQKKK